MIAVGSPQKRLFDHKAGSERGSPSAGCLFYPVWISRSPLPRGRPPVGAEYVRPFRRLHSICDLCLFCAKEGCGGGDACFREQKKTRRQYQADRRKAQQTFAAFCHAEQAKENRGRKMEAQAAFQKRTEADLPIPGSGKSWNSPSIERPSGNRRAVFSCQNQRKKAAFRDWKTVFF